MQSPFNPAETAAQTGKPAESAKTTTAGNGVNNTPQTPADSTNTEYHQHVCRQLIDMAHDMARQIHDAFDPRQPPSRSREQALAFARLAGAIRRTILLAEHLDRPAATPAAAHPRRHAAPNPNSIEADRDLATRPVAETIAQIRHDLGLNPETTPPNPDLPHRPAFPEPRSAAKPAPPNPNRFSPSNPAPRHPSRALLHLTSPPRSPSHSQRPRLAA